MYDFWSCCEWYLHDFSMRIYDVFGTHICHKWKFFPFHGQPSHASINSSDLLKCIHTPHMHDPWLYCDSPSNAFSNHSSKLSCSHTDHTSSLSTFWTFALSSNLSTDFCLGASGRNRFSFVLLPIAKFWAGFTEPPLHWIQPILVIEFQNPQTAFNRAKTAFQPFFYFLGRNSTNPQWAAE